MVYWWGRFWKVVERGSENCTGGGGYKKNALYVCCETVVGFIGCQPSAAQTLSGFCQVSPVGRCGRCRGGITGVVVQSRVRSDGPVGGKEPRGGGA